MTSLPLFFRSRRFWLWSTAVLSWSAMLLLQPILVRADGALSDFGRVLPEAALLPFLCALTCEYLDSSLGMGYGTLLAPLLLLLGYSAADVVPCILMSELATGLLAALLHSVDGNVDFFRDREARSASLWLISLSVLGALAGATLAVKLSLGVLNVAISMIVAGAGVFVLVTAGRRLRYRPSHLVGLGTLAAFNKAVSGGGYGPLVTSGQVVCGIDAKKAVAITSLAESVVCLIGLVTYFFLRGLPDLELAFALIPGALLSVPMATLTVKKLPESVMRRVVGTVTLLLGLLALIKFLAT